jgi:ACS family hexuronate transporter-like MFS transporter
MFASPRWRWFATGVFTISSTLNYMDRTLINVLAPLILTELHLSQTGFGYLISVFSLAYAVSSPLTGWFLDRVGLNRGISAAVAWWSAAGIGTSLVTSVPGLAVCRGSLGLGESAGVPGFGKLNALYLEPDERAIGAAVNQIGLSVGAAMCAPLFVPMAARYSWRVPFAITGALGFAWIPVWLWISRLISPRQKDETDGERRGSLTILKDRNLMLLVIANVLWMGGYSLWTNWTTLYLVHVHNLTVQESARYVWIPPLVSNAGGFFGGWLSLRWIRRAYEPVVARTRAVWVSAAGSLIVLLLPFASGPGWATVFISASFFFALAGSVNIYALPIDLFGAGNAALAVSALTCAFGLLQTVISPIIGYLGDHRLYNEVVWLATVPLVMSAFVLHILSKQRQTAA